MNNGDVEIAGSLTTGGAVCGDGCDLVFDPSYQLESIEEHAAQMWEDRYLGAVGPTRENAPFNLTEKTGGILNELEKAHIYIDRLNDTLKEREAEIARLNQHQTDMLERVARLEAAVEK